MQVTQVDLQVGGKFEEELATSTAWAHPGRGNDVDRLPIPRALGDGLRACGAFGAQGDRIRSVLDVASFKCAALGIDQDATDREVAVGAIGSAGHLASLVHISQGLGMVDRIHGASPRRSRLMETKFLWDQDTSQACGHVAS